MAYLRYLILLLFFYNNGFAQITFYKGTYFKAAKAKTDLENIHQILKRNHPSYAWYTPANITDAAFNNANESIKDSISQLDFILLATKCINNIKCGHTALFYTKKAIDSINKSYTTVFPFNFIPIKDTLININCFLGNNYAFLTGTKVVTINGLTSKQIIDSLKPYHSGDGNADIYRERKLGNNFPFIYRNIFGLPKNLTITFINKETQLDTAQCFLTNNIYYLKPKIKLITKPIAIAAPVMLHEYSSKNAIQFVQAPITSILPPVIKFDTNKLTLKNAKPIKPKNKQTTLTKRQRKKLNMQRQRSLTIDTLNSTAFIYLSAFKGSGFRKFIKHSFKTIKKGSLKNVVIDVRDNGGGLVSKYVYLTKYLSNKRFKVADTVSVPYKKLFKRHLIKQGFWNQAFITFFTTKGSDGRYHIKNYENKYYKLKTTNHFNNNIYIITGAYSFSATTLFANNLKGQQNVTLVGDETGGGHYGNSGILLPDIKIPNTDLILHIPLFRVVINKNANKFGGGLKPDVLATPTAESLFKGTDVKKEAVLNLIKQKLIKPII